jgi:hypothetical protein
LGGYEREATALVTAVLVQKSNKKIFLCIYILAKTKI